MCERGPDGGPRYFKGGIDGLFCFINIISAIFRYYVNTSPAVFFGIRDDPLYF